MTPDYCTTCKTYTLNWHSTFDEMCRDCNPTICAADCECRTSGPINQFNEATEYDPMTAYKEQVEYDNRYELPWGHPDRDLGRY